jgi:ribose transport system permease protein
MSATDISHLKAPNLPPQPEQTLDTTTSWSNRLLLFAENYGLVALLTVLFLFFASAWDRPATFRSTDNIVAVLGTFAAPTILALASIVPLIANQFDLSVGPVAGLSAIITAGLTAHSHYPLIVAALISLAAGIAVGVVNGLLVAYLRVSAFIATLGMSSVISGLVIFYSHSATIIVSDKTLTHIGSASFLGLPIVVYLAALVALLLYYVLEHTPTGRYLHLVGSNEKAARLVGLRVNRVVFAGFVASAGLAAIGGLMLLARNGSADQQLGGLGQTLPALAAAFLGATAIKPGRFNVLGTVIAVLFVAFSLSGLNLNGVSDWVSDFFTGLTLILAVALSTLVGRRRRGASTRT